MDSFSPLAPSRIRVLVLPVGRIQSQPFARFVRRLQREANLVPLTDVEPHVSGAEYELSPKAFPQGTLQYNFTSSAPSAQHLHLSPFELFREPLLVLGVVGGLHEENETRRSTLVNATNYLRERHPRVVHRHLLVLLDGDGDDVEPVHPGIAVTNAGDDGHPALRAAMCELSARFLFELNTYAKALQASPSISTPGQTSHNSHRPSIPVENDRRPTSGYRTPPRGSDSQSPVEDESPARPESRSRGPPPTTFDQMTGTGNSPRAPARSNSRAGNPSDRDNPTKSTNNPVQSKDKLRARGKARVGIVLASIYMMAGHWAEALRRLIEHTTKLRSLSDHLWHGKGLENISVCLLLLARNHVDFQIPALCNPITDRNSASHVPRLSAIIPAEPTSGESAQQAAVRRLSACIPDLSKTILSLYRSVEGSLELPFIAIAEATVRCAKLLAVLANSSGDLSAAALRLLVAGPDSSSSEYLVTATTQRPPVFPKAISRNAISDLLAHVIPRSEDAISIPEQITLLSGIASTYALLGLERKKAIVIRELVQQLRYALVQARKLGAAEMGIHPAASISTETGAETLLAIAAESGGINKLMANISTIYGATLMPESPSDSIALPDSAPHGNPTLKFEVLREFAALCEASPDPYGVLRMNASLLRAGGPNSAIDANSLSDTVPFSREEQLQLTTVINRTVAVSHHLGLTDALAMYWDPFLVRGIVFPPPPSSLAIIDRTKVKAPVDNRIPGNPLLYDPNASRPGTALPQASVLVKNEVSTCVVMLQNPFDVQLEIESLELIVEGNDLETHFEPTTLGPMRIQSIPFAVIPKHAGDTKITGCRVQIHGCRGQSFPIISAPWSAQTPLTLKDPKTTSPSTPPDPAQLLKSLGIEAETTSTVTVDTMPTLVLEESERVDSGTMLLTGEKKPFDLLLRNPSSTTAFVFEITDTAGVVRHVRSSADDTLGGRPTTASSEMAIEAGASKRVHLEITGKAGISNTQINFYYSVTNSSTSNHARLISIPLQLTVNPALQVQNLDIVPPRDQNDDTLQIKFDLGNAWPHLVHYQCDTSYIPSGSHLDTRIISQTADPEEKSGQISSGELRRLYLTLPRPPLADLAASSDESLRTSFLQSLRIHWTITEPDDRHGHVDLIRLPLSRDALSILRGPRLTLTLTATAGAASPFSSSPSSVKVGTFVRIRLTIIPRPPLSADEGSNSDSGGGNGIVGPSVVARGKRQAPRQRPLATQLVALDPTGSSETGQDANTNADRRFAVVGALRRILPSFPIRREKADADGDGRDADGRAEIDFVVCPLVAGVLEFEAVVHPAPILEQDSCQEGGQDEEDDWFVRRKIRFEVE